MWVTLRDNIPEVMKVRIPGIEFYECFVHTPMHTLALRIKQLGSGPDVCCRATMAGMRLEWYHPSLVFGFRIFEKYTLPSAKVAVELLWVPTCSCSHFLKHCKSTVLASLLIPNISKYETRFKPQASRMGGLFVGSRTVKIEPMPRRWSGRRCKTYDNRAMLYIGGKLAVKEIFWAVLAKPMGSCTKCSDGAPASAIKCACGTTSCFAKPRWKSSRDHHIIRRFLARVLLTFAPFGELPILKGWLKDPD